MNRGIPLNDLLKLTNEVYFFIRKIDCDGIEGETYPFERDELKEKFDLKNDMVVSFKPHFICGEYEGLELEVRNCKYVFWPESLPGHEKGGQTNGI